MKIYLRKVFPHDVTHEVSITTEIVREFFDSANSMEFKGIKTGDSGTVTINNATDPRYGGDYKTILNSEGGIEVDDLILTYKYNNRYEVRIIKKSDEEYNTFFGLFKGKERHVIFMMDDELDIEDSNSARVTGAENILLYGVPGVGKSHTIQKDYCNDEKRMERVVFHPDYTYSDFVGQILPRVEDGQLKYVFTPGPFTKMLIKAWNDPGRKYFLIIEEINRGNAPAIFGEIFQLLDRKSTDNPRYNAAEIGESEYGISNYDVAAMVYGDSEHEVRIPSNMWVLATMNTADQNVFTLDTAFQRRWNMHHIKNDVMSATHAQQKIEGTEIGWGAFATVINDMVVDVSVDMASSEDKRLGAYFVKSNELVSDKFPEKVLKYLWDDAFKMDKEAVFDDRHRSLEDIIETYESTKEDKLRSVLRADVYAKMLNVMNKKTEE